MRDNTLYWATKPNATINETNYKKALSHIQTIALSGHAAGILANGSGDNNTKPEITEGIYFNGIEDDSCETFWLPAVGQGFLDDRYKHNWCTTGNKPYTLYVIASLCILNHFCGDTITVSIELDNDRNDWLRGLTLARNITGLDIQNPV